MRYFLFTVAVLLLAATVWFKFLKNDTPKKVGAGQKTVVDIPRKIIDIGDHPRFSPVVARYAIFNKGDHDLYVQDVKPDCHCTVGEFSKNAIRPNDSAEIYLRYDSSIVGIFQSSAVVTANSDQTPLLLILRGKITDSSMQKN